MAEENVDIKPLFRPRPRSLSRSAIRSISPSSYAQPLSTHSPNPSLLTGVRRMQLQVISQKGSQENAGVNFYLLVIAACVSRSRCISRQICSYGLTIEPVHLCVQLRCVRLQSLFEDAPLHPSCRALKALSAGAIAIYHQPFRSQNRALTDTDLSLRNVEEFHEPVNEVQ
jgi:hypothetical protein